MNDQRPQLPQLPLPLAPQALQHRLEYGSLTWIDIIHPTREQVEWLRSLYDFHPLHVDDVLARLKRPKIDDSDDPEYLLLVLHVPYFDKMARLPVISEVEIFVGRTFVITLHDGKIRPLVHLVQSCQKQGELQRLMGRGSGFLLYSIVETLIGYDFPMVYNLYEKLDLLDAEMFRGDVHRIVQELSFLRRDIISLRRIVRPNLSVIRDLANNEREFLRLDEEVYFGNLEDAMNKLWDMLEEQKEIIEGLDATLFSLTSHRLNQEMKLFTLITVIFLPMTLVAGIYGMNFEYIPELSWRFGYPFSLVLMVCVAGGLLFYFRWRRLL
jgi:magnesium transporter